MADQETQTAEPEVSIDSPQFGNLAEAFDKAWPSTKEKPPEGTIPAPEKLKEAPKPAEPVKAPAKASEAPTDDLPEFLTGIPEATVPETKPEEPVLPAPTAKDSVGMKELRKHYEMLKSSTKTQIEQLSKELAESKAKPADSEAQATINDLQAKLAELSSVVEQTNIENHPFWKAKFTEPRKALVEDAHQILQEAKIDPKAWDRVMALPPEMRMDAMEELLIDMNPMAKGELAVAQRQIRSLDAARDRELANRKGLQEKLTQNDMIQRNQALQEREKSTLQLLDMAQKDMVEQLGLETLKKSDNPAHAKWNEGVDRRVADAKKLMLEITDESTMARASLLATSALDFRHLYHRFRERAFEAEKKLKAYENAEPTLETGGGPTPEVDDKLSFAEAVAKEFPRR